MANEDFLANRLLPIASRIGLFVVDEAHCISDWGHDFRPDYRRTGRILQTLPSNVPVLATTATANDRVVADLEQQLGPSLTTIRGSLTRESLYLENIVLPTQAARMAWLAHNLPQMVGSGIIYTLTVRDAESVATWLQSRGINVMPYHADSENREQLEEALLRNQIKALVATVALGMGFDKPDIGFVIHFQRPASVVHYYQQVGRAGRAIEEAKGILLDGAEDDEIADYFISTAFPRETEIAQVLDALRASTTGLRRSDLQQLNLTSGKIDKILKFLLLESPSPIQKIDTRYYLNPVQWQMPRERIERIERLRRGEQQRMREYVATGQCLMQFLASVLNDPLARPCGKCMNCRRTPPQIGVPRELSEAAATFLNNLNIPIEPRKQWPQGQTFEGEHGRIAQEFLVQEGRALCKWGDSGLGDQVKQGKQQIGRFSDELVTAATVLIRDRWKPQPTPTWLTCVPSHRHRTLVSDLAQRLANQLGIPFVDCIRKIRETEPQKTRRNSVQQVKNLDGAFEFDTNLVQSEAVFLIDDMVDSRWTFAVLGFKLRRAGSGPVFLFALADSSAEGGD